MTVRYLVGCLLLVLASVSVIEMMLEAANDHAMLRHQWRARAQHHTTFRLAHRSVPAVTANVPPPVLTAASPVVPLDEPGAPSLLLAAVFVPPRV